MSNTNELLINFEKCINIGRNHEREISKDFTFHDIPNISKFSQNIIKTPQDMIAIDGTSLWLWKHPILDLWLVLNRTVAVKYCIYGEKIKGENIEIIDQPILFSTLRGKNGTIDLELHEEILKFNTESGREHIIIAQGYREIAEYNLAIKMSEKFPNTIITLDGNLNTYKSNYFQSKLNHLLKIIKKNKNSLVGVVKSNKTHRFLSPERDEDLLTRLTKDNHDYLYTELPENPNEINPRFFKIGTSFLVKLHPDALKWFRIDVGHPINDVQNVFANIAHYSCSQELLGYPLPLIDAHQGCISIHKMKDDYLHIFIQIAKRLGISINDLVEGFTNFEGRADSDIHTLLDRISL